MRFACVLFLTAVFAAGACAADLEPTLEAPAALVVQTQTRLFDACNDALLVPIRFTRVGNEVAFASVDTGQEIKIVWPMGFSARLVDGRAELVDSLGVVVAREGDVMDDIGGSGGDLWNACSIGGQHYR